MCGRRPRTRNDANWGNGRLWRPSARAIRCLPPLRDEGLRPTRCRACGRDGESLARWDRHRVAQADSDSGSDAHPGTNRTRRPWLNDEQRSESERAKQSDRRDDRQPWEPIPRRYGTRSDLLTLSLDQTSSQVLNRSRRPRTGSCAGPGRGRPRAPPRSAARAPAGRRAGSPPCGRCSPPSGCRRGR